ncbi:hypothetical protein SERLA73DRAFT_156333 [Serpula lacrymans var. lacrymans S7.3]|uniref:Uncharacterized protein n=1 Tax=Serpula lacrymans var. lacrymans (strain S7.3) TaxID=936435 RepID=F8QE08_SERL3|nr:hypothetical protein SERLA73DRAFT_156333 [Serpula lacrymans var. lacrymans S7.3]
MIRKVGDIGQCCSSGIECMSHFAPPATFLYNNYRQALDILEETLQTEYWQKLIDLQASKQRLGAALESINKAGSECNVGEVGKCKRKMARQLLVTPAGQLAMDRYFKLLWAKEKIQWLNIEIQRVVSYIQDEDMYLHQCKELPSSNRKGRFNEHHLCHLTDIALLPGFSGTVSTCISIWTGPGESTIKPAPIIAPSTSLESASLPLLVMPGETLQMDLSKTEEDLGGGGGGGGGGLNSTGTDLI